MMYSEKQKGYEIKIMTLCRIFKLHCFFWHIRRQIISKTCVEIMLSCNGRLVFLCLFTSHSLQHRCFAHGVSCRCLPLLRNILPVPLECSFPVLLPFKNHTLCLERLVLLSMASVVQIFLWAWIIKHSRVCSDSLPENTSKRFVIECLEEHNRARSSVNPPARDMLFMVGIIGI